MRMLNGNAMVFAGAMFAAAAATYDVRTVHGQENAAQSVFYIAKVKPIFDASCARCHGGLNHRGGLNMETREGLLTGGHHGPSIVPGDPQKSLLVRLIRHEGPADDPMDMPPHADKLSAEQIALVETWVKAGAAMPASAPPATH